MLLLGCLSLRGPLGLAPSSYLAQVRRLDVAYLNFRFYCKASWGHPSMTGVLSCHALPASLESLTISQTPHVNQYTLGPGVVSWAPHK